MKTPFRNRLSRASFVLFCAWLLATISAVSGGGGDPGPVLRQSCLVEYCNLCGVPSEYCGDVACPRAKLRGHSGRNGEAVRAAAPKVNVSSAGGEEDAGTNQSASTRSEKAMPKSAKAAAVTIKLVLRGTKKFVTTISGLERYMPAGSSLKDVSKRLANSLAAGASVVKGGPGQEDHIAVQGDFVQRVQDLCASKLKVPIKAIKIASTESKSWKMT